MADGDSTPCNCPRRRIAQCSQVPLLILWLGMTSVHADDCFCLLDDQRTPYRDCVEVSVRGLSPVSVECRLTTDKKRKPIANGKAMQRIEAGEPGCHPCRVEGNRHIQVIRNNGKGQDPDPVDQNDASPVGVPDD